MEKIRHSKILIPILIICFIFVGCSPTNSNPNNDVINDTKSTETSTEKIIRMSVSGTPKVDPQVGNNTVDSIARVNLYDSLVYPTLDGTIEPSLAESWEYDDTSCAYTFKLRQGVKFHSGEELTSKDVVFSMNRHLTIGEGSAYLFKGVVKEVVSVDDYTVKFILEKPYGPFVSTLTNLSILCENEVMKNIDSNGSYGEFGDYGRNWLLTHDAGSGPYVVKELQQQGYLLATRFEDYWRGWDNRDAPDIIKLIDNTEASTVRTMMGNKELEITDEWQSTENIAAMSKLPGVEVAKISTGLVQNMMYNNKKAPTDDENFRRALNCLYNYEMISTNIFVDSPQANGPVSANTPGAYKNSEKFKYDIEKAKEYLQKSKYADRLDEYPVELLVNTDVADHEKIALALQASAQQIGIKVNISKAPWISIQEQVAKVDTTPNVICISVSPHFMEAGSMLLSRYHSSSVGTWEQGEWLQNDDIDHMIEDALATIDDNERFKKYEDIQKILVEEIIPSGWLVDLVQRHAYRSDYVYWPIAELSKSGEIPTLPAGYPFDFSQMKIYIDKR